MNNTDFDVYERLFIFCTLNGFSSCHRVSRFLAYHRGGQLTGQRLSAANVFSIPNGCPLRRGFTVIFITTIAIIKTSFPLVGFFDVIEWSSDTPISEPTTGDASVVPSRDIRFSTTEYDSLFDIVRRVFSDLFFFHRVDVFFAPGLGARRSSRHEYSARTICVLVFARKSCDETVHARFRQNFTVVIHAVDRVKHEEITVTYQKVRAV